MKVILLGNAGAGKSTLAKKLIEREHAAILTLDEVAFHTGSIDRKPLQDSVSEVQAFISRNESWIIEGCYADIIMPLLETCEELYFINPGIKTSIENCKKRPWEPDKFESKEEQDLSFTSTTC